MNKPISIYRLNIFQSHQYSQDTDIHLSSINVAANTGHVTVYVNSTPFNYEIRISHSYKYQVVKQYIHLRLVIES